MFVLASWRVLCVCCNQITNDHKKSSSSALRLQCVVVIVVVFILMPQAARLHFKERDPPILSLTKQSSLVWFWFWFTCRFHSIHFVSLRCFTFVTPRFVLFLFQIFKLLHLLVNVLSFIAFNELRNTHTHTQRSPFRGVSNCHVPYNKSIIKYYKRVKILWPRKQSAALTIFFQFPNSA